MELLEKHYAKSLIVNAKGINVDVFYIIFEGTEAFGSFLRVHDGGIIQSMNLEIRMRIEEQEPEVLGSFISGVYEKLRDYGEEAGTRPPEIVVPFMPDMPEALPEVTFTVPEKGDRLALLELGRKNAAAIKFERLKHEEFVNPEEHSARIVENLRKDLGMDVPPVHIECFDNSNIQGTNPVASCVVFRDGAPSRKDYRHFNIKTVVGPDDFASMKEVVNRRYTRLLAEGQELPQLIVIDGGRGQVNAAYEALDEIGLIGKVKLIGLAKRMEEVIVPGDPYPHFIGAHAHPGRGAPLRHHPSPQPAQRVLPGLGAGRHPGSGGRQPRETGDQVQDHFQNQEGSLPRGGQCHRTQGRRRPLRMVCPGQVLVERHIEEQSEVILRTALGTRTGIAEAGAQRKVEAEYHEIQFEIGSV